MRPRSTPAYDDSRRARMTMANLVFLAVTLLSTTALLACGGSSLSSRESPSLADTPVPSIALTPSPSPTSGTAEASVIVTVVQASPILQVADVTIRASYSAALAPDNPSRPEAPDFSLTLHDGATFTLARHRGEAVVLYFSFTRCGVCIPGLKAVGQIATDFGSRGVSVIAVNIDGRTTVEGWRAYWKEVGGSDALWAVDDQKQTITVPYEIALHETVVIIDRNSRIAFRDVVVDKPYATIRANLEIILDQGATSAPIRPTPGQEVPSGEVATTAVAPSPPARAMPGPTEPTIPSSAGAKRAGGVAAPDFSLPTGDGSVFRLADQKGTRVLLYLAFVGCPSCGFMVPILGKIQTELGPDEIKVVAIDIYPDKLEAWEKYWRELGGGEVVWVVDDPRAPGGSVSRKYELTEAGTIVMIDREGQVAKRHGFLPPADNLYQQLLEEVRALP